MGGYNTDHLVSSVSWHNEKAKWNDGHLARSSNGEITGQRGDQAPMASEKDDILVVAEEDVPIIYLPVLP